jgi:hypothetical protein
MARCSMYKHREDGTYFIVCSNGSADPPMPNADVVTWWEVDSCQNCKVPAGYPVPDVPKMPSEPVSPPVPTPTTPPHSPPQACVSDLGSNSWHCDGDEKKIFDSVVPAVVVVFVEPCPLSSAKIFGRLRDNAKPVQEVVVDRPMTVMVVGQVIGLECGKSHETDPNSKCSYRIVSVSKA